MSRDLTLPRYSVIGAGHMGRGIIHVLLSAGRRVMAFDPNPQALERLARDVAGHEEGQRLEIASDVESCVRDTRIIFESIVEDFEAKSLALNRCARASEPTVPICSNTSALSVQDLADECPSPERVLGVHWFNPPEVIPGVEVAPTTHTSSAILDTTLHFLHDIGKRPAQVAPVPGYIANRLHEALIAEAIRCVEAGWATVETVDAIVKNTFGPRFALFGPFEVVDRTGLVVQRAALRSLADDRTGAAYSVGELLDKHIASGRTGTQAGAGFYDYPTKQSQKAQLAMLAQLFTLRDELLGRT